MVKKNFILYFSKLVLLCYVLSLKLSVEIIRGEFIKIIAEFFLLLNFDVLIHSNLFGISLRLRTIFVIESLFVSRDVTVSVLFFMMNGEHCIINSPWTIYHETLKPTASSAFVLLILFWGHHWIYMLNDRRSNHMSFSLFVVETE